ncbi:CUTiclin-Like [Dirofilaria immitis]|nr:CUTiclin-Like [Dirofilaria immitis]
MRLRKDFTKETYNDLIGSPEIKCNPDTIELAFKTKREFRGKVFVKGHYSNPNCRVDYGNEILDSRNLIGGIILNHGQCDMNRRRMIQPEGMQFSTILIISFHPLFITKLDRAFHIKCTYREVVRVVSSGIEVSAITTQALEYEYPFPNCIYTIRRDEIDGPILKYARVGDQIVHRWECLSDIYGLLVHNCYVEDGQGENKLSLMKTDRAVLGDPTYVESLNMAYRESLVFKFADRVIIQFQCQIRLCVKEAGGCVGITPPICFNEKQERNKLFATTGESMVHHVLKMSNITDYLKYYRWQDLGSIKKRRLMRSPISERSKLTIDADLISQPVYVLDNDDEGTDEHNEVCVSNALFAIFVCIMIVVLLVLTVSSVWLMHRWLRSSGSIMNEYYNRQYISHISVLSF